MSNLRQSIAETAISKKGGTIGILTLDAQACSITTVSGSIIASGIGITFIFSG